MANPYIGQIILFGGTYAPVGYLPCDGRTLNIADYNGLYALIGTTYGGDGNTTFNLPKLGSTVPVHNGTLAGGSNYVVGQTGGSNTVTLNGNQLGGHTHGLNVVTGTAAGAASSPSTSTYLADEAANSTPSTAYVQPTTQNATVLVSTTIGATGGSQPHGNIQPNVAITICIATEGVFPS